MTSKPLMDNHVREKIIADPDVLLEDQDIMRALVAANEQTMGTNIVDLRGIAMERNSSRSVASYGRDEVRSFLARSDD